MNSAANSILYGTHQSQAASSMLKYSELSERKDLEQKVLDSGIFALPGFQAKHFWQTVNTVEAFCQDLREHFVAEPIILADNTVDASEFYGCRLTQHKFGARVSIAVTNCYYSLDQGLEQLRHPDICSVRIEQQWLPWAEALAKTADLLDCPRRTHR